MEVRFLLSQMRSVDWFLRRIHAADILLRLLRTLVFVGSGIFLSGEPLKRARAIVQAVCPRNAHLQQLPL